MNIFLNMVAQNVLTMQFIVGTQSLMPEAFDVIAYIQVLTLDIYMLCWFVWVVDLILVHFFIKFQVFIIVSKYTRGYFYNFLRYHIYIRIILSILDD